MDQKEILKQLLLVELEDMKTFDDDPMGFILRKYKSLNDTLIELMTRSYKEYLYGVYIVAPKPTTFKVVLHNKQYFYLVYLGPTYEASVAGKNYYLSDLGEKERCIVAISKMLRGGPPINTKGPEGAEKGSKDQEGGGGGGNFGGGGDQSGGGEEGEPELTASAAADAEGGGEPEELTENAKLILKLLLERDLNKDKDTEGSEEEDSKTPQQDVQTKKKTRLPQTPILKRGSLTPSSLNIGGTLYSGPNQIIGLISEAINSNIISDNKEQEESTKKFIISICEDVEKNTKKISQDKITDIYDNIMFSKETIEASKGVNREDLHKIIGVEFGEVLGAVYLSKKISNKKIYFPTDKNNAIYDFQLRGSGKENVIKVSSKYKKGAASSLTEIINENEQSGKKETLSQDAKSMLQVFQESYKKGVSISYLYLAKNLKDKNLNEAFDALEESLGIRIDLSKSGEIIKKRINNRIRQLRRGKNGDENVKTVLNNFYERLRRKQISSQVQWDKLPVKDKKIQYYGLVTSPIAYFLTEIINKQPEEAGSDKETLRELVRNTEVRLIRLNFALKDKSTQFISQSTKSDTAKFFFYPKVTANDPEKGFISFRME